jgi:hypothetical protein
MQYPSICCTQVQRVLLNAALGRTEQRRAGSIIGRYTVTMLSALR